MSHQARGLQSSIYRIYHDYPRSFWVLVSGSFVDRFGTNLILPFLAVYIAKYFNANMTQIGLIFTVFAVTGVGGNLLAGAMADKFGRRAVLIIGLIGSALARVGMGLATDMNGLYVMAVFAGFFGTVGLPAQTAIVADLLPEHQRADGFGIQRVVTNLTWVLGPLIGGLLAPLTGYLLLFILDAITSFIMALIVFTMLPETNPQRAEDQPADSIGRALTSYGQVVRDGVFMAFILVSVLMMMAYFQMYSTLSVFLVKFQQLPESFYGALLMVNAGMVVVLQFPITRWTSRQPPMLVMLGGTALCLVGLTAYGVVASAFWYVAAMVLITAGEMLVTPTGQALVASLAPRDKRARYIAMHGFIWIVPQALGPLSAGLVMDHFDPRWVWYACGLLCTFSIAGFYGLHFKTRQRLNQALLSDLETVSLEAVAAQEAL